MKLKSDEKQALSDSIDKLNEGLDFVIGLYNDSEEDKPVIEFDQPVLDAIEKAKEIYGTEEVTRKINTIIKEIFEFLPKEIEENN